MRNVLGGITAALIGSLLLGGFPDGTDILRQTYALLLEPELTLNLLVTWVLLGFISGVASDSKWNTVRTAVWIGISIGAISIAGILSNTPEFWTSPDRNLELLFIFVSAITAALSSVPSAVAIVLVKARLLEEQEMPAPEKIESICSVCGAVFKSVPLLCSECGATINQEGVAET